MIWTRWASRRVPSQVALASCRWFWAVSVVVMWVFRAIWIRTIPELDADSFGHFAIAQQLVIEPTRLSHHWVWLPGYHYWLWALLHLGISLQGVRWISSGLAATIPIVVFLYMRTLPGSSEQIRDERAAWGALLCAFCPVVNMLGVSAQQEILFTSLILVGAWAGHARRWGAAGFCLGLGCLIRYEAWGAAALIGLTAIGARLPWLSRVQVLTKSKPWPWWSVLAAALAAGAWIALHRHSDGEWFVFLHELRRYTNAQRVRLSRGFLFDLFWFPIILPFILFGPPLLLTVRGLRSSWNSGYWLPLGIATFLMVSYATNGSLGSPRYLCSLSPFLCIAIAYALHDDSTRWLRWHGLKKLSLASFILLLMINMNWMTHWR